MSTFAAADLELLSELSRSNQIGHLAIVSRDGYPRTVPMNFVLVGDRIYFHGAPDGEKAEALARGDRVTFCVYTALAATPSYWRSANYACPASQYFRSALVRGRGGVVRDAGEKAAALQALMEKHQPEGGFERIDPANPLYSKALEETAVFRINIERIDTRAKLGQNLSEATRRTVIEKLVKRDGPGDAETARLMAQVKPVKLEEE